MPLTLAHPLVVLPLRRAGLPMSALVLGSMAPDVPLFVGARGLYPLTHSPVGVVTVDVVVVLVGLVLWFNLVRDALVDLAPAVISKRFRAQARLTTRQWWLVLPAAVIGAASHVVWDAFTHVDGWGTAHVEWLRQVHGPFAGDEWAQYVSGIVGSVLVGVVASTFVVRRPVLREHVEPRALGTWALPAVAVASGLVGVVVALSRIPAGLHLMAFDAVVSTIATGVALMLVTTVAWRVLSDRRDVVRG